MKYLTLLLLFIPLLLSAQSSPFDDFDKVMEEYNEAYVKATTPIEQEQVNVLYESIIAEAEAKLEADLEKIVQSEQEALEAEEKAFNEKLKAQEEADEKLYEEAFVSPIEGVHECYFKDTFEEIIANKTIEDDHNNVLEILGLEKGGSEKDKVGRILEELVRLGYRESINKNKKQ